MKLESVHRFRKEHDQGLVDHDPLFRFHRWLAHLRVLEVEEVKTVPHAPMSHPYVERLIGTIRREYLDRTFFWNSIDLHRKLKDFQNYYNVYRVHRSLDGTTPANHAGGPSLSTQKAAAMHGNGIAGAYSRHRSRLDWQFASHRCVDLKNP